MAKLREYGKVVGRETIEKLMEQAEKISDKHIVTVNSTYHGGGVAELLNSVVHLFNEAGVKMGWRILHGSDDFFTVTKKLHNSLQGEKVTLSEREKRLYNETNEFFSEFTHLDHDMVVLHDVQPLPLIRFYKKKQPWIFRCHVDLSSPYPPVWDYLKSYISRYDHMVVSKKEYMKADLSIPQSIISPAIDPLSIKNKRVSERTVGKILRKYDIARDKPIVSQISRFDKWKDPEGVIRIFESVRKNADCRLVLLGSLAPDDPEGQSIFDRVKEQAKKSKYEKDITVLLVKSDILANCLQRASSVIIQKSLKEGFGLTVSEALFKGVPVVASNAGGIPLQVIDGVNGFLCKPDDVRGFSAATVKLLNDEKLREQMGKHGKEYITDRFLTTRLMLDWMDLFIKYLK